GAITLALLTLASPSQPLIHAIFIGGVLFLGRSLTWLAARDGLPMRRAIGGILAMGALALLLSAPSVVPSLLNLGHMIRFLGDFPPITGNSRMPFEATLIAQMAPAQLASVIMPLQVPLIVGSWFIGLGGVLFALFGLVDIRRNWLVGPLALLTLYGLLSAMGSHSGLAQINYHVPFLNMIREPPRHMVVFMLGASALAAFGFDALTAAIAESDRARAQGLKRFAIPSALFLVIVALASRTSLAYAGTVPMWAVLAAFVACIAMLASAMWLRAPIRGAAFGAAAILAFSANLAHPHANLQLRVNDYLRPANLSSHRVLAEVGRIPDARWCTEVGQAQGIRHYYALLGGKYYVCGACTQVDKTTYRPVRQIEGYKLYQADSALPLYFAVGRVAGLFETPHEFIERVEAGFDAAREVFLDRTVGIPQLNQLLATPADVLQAVIKEERRTLNVLELGVNTNRQAIVVLNEYFSDSWIATVNGIPAPALRINLNQIGVLVDPGSNLVRFEYRPWVFVWLLRLQAVVAGVLALWGAARLWRTYRPSIAMTTHARSRSS